MSQPSLRRTFLLPILAVMTIGFAVFAIYVDSVEGANRLDDLDAELLRAEQGRSVDPALGTAGALNADRPTPDGQATTDGETDTSSDVLDEAPIEVVIDDRLTVISTGTLGNPFSVSALEELSEVEGFATVSEVNLRAVVSPGPGGQRSITALSLDPLDTAASEFRRALGLGAFVILSLVAAVTWLLVGRVTRPITQLTSAAHRIADGELETDLSVQTRSLEMTALTEDLDRMLNQIRGTIDQAELSAADATRARDDMGRFLADMAHELRTPLTALKGYSDLYAGGMLAETKDVDRAMSRIGSESERLYRLVDEMLELARTGNAVAATEPVDVMTIADVVASDLRAANPDLRIECRGEQDLKIDGVPAQIHQSLLNLGANACGYSSAGDRVELAVHATDRSVVVQVLDHGPGVSSHDKERIFLPFFRADESRVRGDNGGAGLGLALTKQIVTQHNGTIEVGDTPGGGATFTLTFPRLA